jgi:hypothetical protein
MPWSESSVPFTGADVEAEAVGKPELEVNDNDGPSEVAEAVNVGSPEMVALAVAADEGSTEDEEPVNAGSLEETVAVALAVVTDEGSTEDDEAVTAASLDETMAVTVPDNEGSVEDDEAVTAASLDETVAVTVPDNEGSVEDDEAVTAASLDETVAVTVPDNEGSTGDEEAVKTGSLDETVAVVLKSRDAVEDSTMVEEFEAEAGAVCVTLQAVEVKEAVTIPEDEAPTVEVTLSVPLVTGMPLGAAVSDAEVAVSVLVALTVMVGKMGRPCWMLVDEAVAVVISVLLAVTVPLGKTDEALPVIEAEGTYESEAVAEAEIEIEMFPDSLLVGCGSAAVELRPHDAESDWDAVTVAVPLGAKVGSPVGIAASVEAEIEAVAELLSLTGADKEADSDGRLASDEPVGMAAPVEAEIEAVADSLLLMGADTEIDPEGRTTSDELSPDELALAVAVGAASADED